MNAGAGARMAEPWAGRTLRRAMVDGGLEAVTATPLVITSGPESIPVFARVLGRQVETNRVTREELDRFESELTAAGARGAFTMALTMFVAVGMVPER